MHVCLEQIIHILHAPLYDCVQQDLLGSAAIRYINDLDGSKPFFMYLPWGAVHTPIQAPQKYIDMYPSSWSAIRREYAGRFSFVHKMYIVEMGKVSIIASYFTRSV